MVSPKALSGVQLVGAGKNRGEAKVLLGPNLTEGRAGIQGSDRPSDWSILTVFVNTQASMRKMSNTIWRRLWTVSFND